MLKSELKFSQIFFVGQRCSEREILLIDSPIFLVGREDSWHPQRRHQHTLCEKSFNSTNIMNCLCWFNQINRMKCFNQYSEAWLFQIRLFWDISSDLKLLLNWWKAWGKSGKLVPSYLSIPQTKFLDMNIPTWADPEHSQSWASTWGKEMRIQGPFDWICLVFVDLSWSGACSELRQGNEKTRTPPGAISVAEEICQT